MSIQELTLENLDDLDPRILAAFKLEMRRAVADCMDRPNDKSAREVSLVLKLEPMPDDDGQCDRASGEFQIKSTVQQPLLHAIEETVDVYECLTRGNPLQPICFGKPVRDLWYQALGREPLPENIPADFDPTHGAMERVRLEKTAATLRAALERAEPILALAAERLRLIHETAPGALSAREFNESRDAAENAETTLAQARASLAGGDGWIPVSERLPEPGLDVLTCEGREDGRVILVSTIDEHGGWFPGYNVTHWRPLPAPPAAKEATT